MKKSIILFILTRLFAIFFMSAILSDTHYYLSLAEKMFNGAVPYIDFPFEYPPFALFAIYLPGVISTDNYRLCFMLMALIFDCLIFWEVLKRNQCPIFYVFLSACLLPFSLERLDIIMIFPMIMAIMNYQQIEFNKAIVWSTVGGWFKLIPFISYIGTFNHKGQFLRTQIKIILLNLVLLTIFSMSFYSNMFDFLKYHVNRPFQVESVAASFVFVSSMLFGTSSEIVNSFGSQNVLFTTMETFLSLATYFLIASFAFLIYFYNKHKEKINLFDIMSLFIFCLLIFSKVLSDQFFIWPLACLFLGTIIKNMNKFDKFILSIVYLFTCLIFVNYWSFIGKGGIWYWILFLKNISLIYIAIKSFCIINKQTRMVLGDHPR